MLDVSDHNFRTGEEQRPEPWCGKAYWPVRYSSFSLLGVKSHLAFPTALQHVVLCVCPPGKQVVRGHRDGREGTREGLGRRHAIGTEVLT